MKKIFFIRLCSRQRRTSPLAGRPRVYPWIVRFSGHAKKCFGEMSARRGKPETCQRIIPTSMPKLSERISAYFRPFLKRFRKVYPFWITSRGKYRYHGLARGASIFIRAYQDSLGLVLPSTCRHYPCCSDYALEAMEKFGLARGLLKMALRILRCHPFAKGGYDPA